MKKHLSFWLTMFLAVSLALPLYSMAQTKLTLEDSTGNRISTPGIKSYALGTDNNLVILLDQPFNFTDLSPSISLDNTTGTYTNCTIAKPATVTATQPAAGTSLLVAFKVISAADASVSLVVDPEGRTPLPSPSTGSLIFPVWDIGGPNPVPVGSYLAVFQATAAAGNPTSQLVVMINIVPPGYTLTTNAANGTVTKNPDQATYTISPVQTVQLTATPAAGYYFNGWSGDLTGTDSAASITMNGNKTVTANFTATPPPPTTYTVSLSASPTAGGTVSQSGTGTYNSGDLVTVTATPNSGYTFSYWTEGAGVVNNSSSFQFNVASTRTLVANFSGSTPPPPPAGEALVWGNRYQFSLSPGTQRVFIATVGQNVPGFSVEIMGISNETDATFTWTFPDGRVFPPPGEPRIYATAGAGKMRLVGLAGGWLANIPDYYIPPGAHVLTIKSTSQSSMVMIVN